MINKEDKADVKRAMGKAIANKVSKVTNDKKTGDTKITREDGWTRHVNKSGQFYKGTYNQNDAKNKAIHAKTGWTKADERAHQSDVKAGRSWNKMGRNGAPNPHL